MYIEYFGLKEAPFSIAPDPRYVYLSEQHREALAHLLYGIQSEGGFVLLTGEVGTGKTTICRCLLEQIPENHEVAFIFNPKLTVRELLSTICDEFGIRYPKGNKSIKIFTNLINSYLLDVHAKGRKAVLIVDEAQNLSADVLEQIRLLTNLETNQRKLLQIILLGQPELREKLSKHQLRQLSQRIIARFHLGPLKKQEMSAYISHRLAVAGSRRPLFGSSTVEHLYRLSGGIPRLVNILCDRALLGAYVQGKEKVDKGILNQAAREVFGGAFSRGRSIKRVAIWGLAALVLISTGVLLTAAYYRYGPQIALFKQPVWEEKADPADEKFGPPITKKHSPIEFRSSILGKEAGASLHEERKLKMHERERLARTENIPVGTQDLSLSSDQDETRGSEAPELSEVAAKDAPLSGQRKEAIGEETRVGPAQETLEKKPLARLERPRDVSVQASEMLALKALFSEWNAEYDPKKQAPACDQAAMQGLRCLSGKGSLADLRRMNRPAILQLADANTENYYAALIEIDGNKATLILGGSEVTVPLDEIALQWHGHYTLLWKLPPEYQKALQIGDQGPSVEWLRQRLSKLGQTAALSDGADVFNKVVLEEVKRFQILHGLQPDGVVGPQTVIALNTATGEKVPTLVNVK